MTDRVLAMDGHVHRPQRGASDFWHVTLVLALLVIPVFWGALGQPGNSFELGASYLPVHTAVEVVSIIIASLIFTLGWHNISDKMPCNLIILSAAFLAVALLDLCHMLSLEGMPDFVTAGSMSKAIAFGLASRTVTAVALLIVALVPWGLNASTPIRYIALGASLATVALAAWLVLYRLDFLPIIFIEGQGPTLLKIWVEEALLALYAAACVVFLWRAWDKRDRNARYLAVAAAIMAVSQMCFMRYAQRDDLLTILSHFYKIIAGGYLYGAVFLDALREPYQQLRRSEQSRLEQLMHDTLTGLPNRALAAQKLRQAIVRARLNSSMVAVFFLDVDFFKKVNATFGHSVGDEVIRACVGRLAPAMASGNTLARQAGDEFIILQENITDAHQAALLAESLLRRMREPFHIQGHEIFLSASVGITLFPEDETTENGLLHKAHIAMNSVKKDARNSYRFHTVNMERGLRERLMMESSLHHALDNEELLLHYQPKVNFSTGAVVGVEALVRWNHPVLGQVPPASFIPIAEENGCIGAIGMWVLKKACAQAREWQGQSLPQLRVSVNLSARQFHQSQLAEQVGEVLRDTGLDASCLELEITESTVMQDTEVAITALQSLKELGVVLSVDDFGTGYSSLSCLKRFPIDVLKIDRSFVNDVTRDPNDAAITKAIIALAHGLDLSVVAEGVETREQALFLQAHGCEEMQGFFFSRPVAPDQLADLLRAPAREYQTEGAVSAASPI